MVKMSFLLLCYTVTLLVCERGRTTALAISPGHDIYKIIERRKVSVTQRGNLFQDSNVMYNIGNIG